MDIVDELTNWEGEYHYPHGLLLRAADQIKQLRAEVKILSNSLERVRSKYGQREEDHQGS
jgi:hypothetical protein